jgi:hypothetical protein
LYAFRTTTQIEKRADDYAKFWNKHNVSSYGFEFDNRTEPNGFIRLGQQVCDPPTDCDKPWVQLIDEFAETPVVEDIRFSTERPNSETDDDLRFLYPGDDQIVVYRMAQHGW